MKARWATLADVPEAFSFIIANRKGNLDPAIFQYPTTRILRAENGNGSATLYMPVHSGVIIESLGWKSELSAVGKVEAGVTALEQVERESWAAGVREVFFVSSDERTDEFCERLGYERIVCMRKKL